MKVFVTGVAGQLGHDVMNELNKRTKKLFDAKRKAVEANKIKSDFLFIAINIIKIP